MTNAQPDIEAVVARNRARILKIESQPAKAIARDYLRAQQVITARATALAVRVEAARAAGRDPFSPMLEQARLSVLLDQTRGAIEQVTERTGDRIERAASEAIAVSATAVGPMAAAMDVRAQLNTVATERIVSAFAARSPLRAALSNLPGAAQLGVRNALINGVVLGDNPRVVARSVRLALGGNMNRALTLSRTEVLRAYRGANQEHYRNNREIVGAWMWVSSRSRRTCPICWAMHGTIHPLDEVFATHPNCRCSNPPVPNTRRPDLAPAIPSGEERFAAMTLADQRFILGPAKYRAYQAGRIKLPDLVGTGSAGPWGTVRFERSLRSILGSGADQFYRGAA